MIDLMDKRELIIGPTICLKRLFAGWSRERRARPKNCAPSSSLLSLFCRLSDDCPTGSLRLHAFSKQLNHCFSVPIAYISHHWHHRRWCAFFFKPDRCTFEWREIIYFGYFRQGPRSVSEELFGSCLLIPPEKA